MALSTKSSQKCVLNVRKNARRLLRMLIKVASLCCWFCFGNLLSVDILTKSILFSLLVHVSCCLNITCSRQYMQGNIYFDFLAGSGELHVLLFYFFLPSTSLKSGTIASCNAAFRYSLRKLNF